MSAWLKETEIEADFDTVCSTLEECGIPYEIKTNGWVTGYGINDIENLGSYPLRQMKYIARNGRKVHRVERIIRRLSNEKNDLICSKVLYGDLLSIGPDEKDVNFKEAPQNEFFLELVEGYDLETGEAFHLRKQKVILTEVFPKKEVPPEQTGGLNVSPIITPGGY